MVSGQERCGPENAVSAVEADRLLILDDFGRLKLQLRLVAAGAIVISRDDGLSTTQHLPHNYYSNEV